MGLNLCILASGSSGNSVYISSDTTRLLIDAGLSAREIERRLGLIGRSPAELSAVCVTHEHVDHTRGLAVLQKRYQTPLYANSGTIDGYQATAKARALQWRVFTTGQAFQIGDITLEPFSVPHDAFEPVGYIAMVPNGTRLGIVTDMGLPTVLIRNKLAGCDALVVESNHDEKLLEESLRPRPLKSRIRGRLGHLSNRQAADMLAAIGCQRLQRIILAHLSSDCNCPGKAREETLRSLRIAGLRHVDVSCAAADRVSEVWTISRAIAHPDLPPVVQAC